MPDDRDDPEPRRMIYEIRRRVQAARNHYWSDGVDGEISEETHRQLAVTTLQYYDVLLEFRDESIIGEEGFPDISVIRDRVGERANVVAPSPGLGRPDKPDTVPAVTQVPVERILQLSEQLDDLAKQLGFGAKAETKTDLYGVDPNWDPDDQEEEEDNASTAD